MTRCVSYSHCWLTDCYICTFWEAVFQVLTITWLAASVVLFATQGRTCYCLLLEHVCRNRSQTLKSLPRWTQLIRFPGMGIQRNLDVGESSRPETMMGTVAGHAAHCQHSGDWTQPWAVKCSWTMGLNPIAGWRTVTKENLLHLFVKKKGGGVYEMKARSLTNG